MSRIVYVNGRYRAYSDAAVHVEDRGFQFADAVYEVMEVRASALVDEGRHLDRLERSLRELEMTMPMSRAALRHVLRETVRRNLVRDGSVYLQVTRGAAPRDFVLPSADTTPTVVVIARRSNPDAIDARAKSGIAVVTAPDERWARRDIKTVMLLPAALAKSRAARAGAREAWLVDPAGFITEGAASNAWIIDQGGTLITRPTSRDILAGVTRATLLDAIAALGLRIVERAFNVAEARAAREAFVTAATNTVMPVVSIDGHPIGDGKPGPVGTMLRSRFHDFAVEDKGVNTTAS